MQSRRRRRLTPMRVLVLLLLVFGVLWLIFGLTEDDTQHRGQMEERPVPTVRIPEPRGTNGLDTRIDAPPPLRVAAAVEHAESLDHTPPPDAATAMGSDGDTGLADAVASNISARPYVNPPRGGGSDASSGLSSTPSISTPSAGSASVTRLTDLLAELDHADASRMIEPRRRLSALLFSGQLDAHDANRVREALTAANARLVFSPGAVAGDPLTQMIRVQPGDRLGAIGSRFNVPYPLLAFINEVEPSRLRAGQLLKVLRGPIHGRVDADAFILDTYVETGQERIFLQSFPVGLGTDGGTPAGGYTVGRDKVINPSWRNPRTGEFFPRDHPDIPIGEYWIPLIGTSGAAATATGIGIHGTNEPDSIGRQMSMGCIRLGDADIAQVFMMLSEGSRVDVEP